MSKRNIGPAWHGEISNPMALIVSGSGKDDGYGGWPTRETNPDLIEAWDILRRINVNIPALTLAEAEDLWPRCDYAFEATHQDEHPIHGPDAAAFFLEGYDHARKLAAVVFREQAAEIIRLRNEHEGAK